MTARARLLKLTDVMQLICHGVRACSWETQQEPEFTTWLQGVGLLEMPVLEATNPNSCSRITGPPRNQPMLFVAELRTIRCELPQAAHRLPPAQAPSPHRGGRPLQPLALPPLRGCAPPVLVGCISNGCLTQCPPLSSTTWCSKQAGPRALAAAQSI